MNMMSDLPIKKIIRESLIVWLVVILIIWLRKIFLLYFSTEVLMGLMASIGVTLFEFYTNKIEKTKQKNINEIEILREQINEISDKLDYNLLSLQNMSSKFETYDVSLDKLRNEIHNKHLEELKDMNIKLFLLLEK